MKAPTLHVVFGLGFGDEGKGHTVAWLTKRHQAQLIVRYNGGPQAAHHVVFHGKSHVFAQFGAGILVYPRVQTFLSQQMVIEPIALLKEATVHHENGLPDPLARLFIDARCPVVTRYDRFLNRARETIRGHRRLGSVGRGVGETFRRHRLSADVHSRIGELTSRPAVLRVCKQLQARCEAELQGLAVNGAEAERMFANFRCLTPSRVADELWLAVAQIQERIVHDQGWLARRLQRLSTIFEGAQGTLLDREFGTVPHVTQCTTRCCAAKALIPSSISAQYIGVTRPYAHRHGAGPLPTESDDLPVVIQQDVNSENPWQGPFRVGYFDEALAKESRRLNPEMNALVITNLDRLSGQQRILMATGYGRGRQPDEPLTRYLDCVQPELASVPMSDVVERICEAYSTSLLAVSRGPENAWHDG